jgi:hypothetical protein
MGISRLWVFSSGELLFCRRLYDRPTNVTFVEGLLLPPKILLREIRNCMGRTVLSRQMPPQMRLSSRLKQQVEKCS